MEQFEYLKEFYGSELADKIINLIIGKGKTLSNKEKEVLSEMCVNYVENEESKYDLVVSFSTLNTSYVEYKNNGLNTSSPEMCLLYTIIDNILIAISNME
jgi:hypothetical protein